MKRFGEIIRAKPAGVTPRIAVVGIALAVGLAACSGGGKDVVSPSVTTAIALEIEPAPPPVPEDVAVESVTAVLLASSGLEIDADLVAATEQVEADLLAQAATAIGPQGIRPPSQKAATANGPQRIRRLSQGIATAGGMSAVGIFIDLVSRLTTGAQQPYSTSFESPTSTTASGTLKMGAKLSGDGAGSTSTEISFQAEVETPDGRTVTERISGTVAGPALFALADVALFVMR